MFMTIPTNIRRSMYETMVRSRFLDDSLTEQYWIGKRPVFAFGAGPLPGELHTSHGQEPVGAGVCAALTDDDMITTGHRPHHIAVARNVDLKKMAAELFGKKAGLSGGRGGHMHIYDKSVNFSSSGIIAEGLGPAAGMAFARKMQKKPGVALSFLGDGAVNQGAFHEVMNIVGLQKLPFICVIEDNKWAVTTHKSMSTAIERNSDRAPNYGMAGEFVQGNDPDLIYAAAQRALERARSGGGGTILEIETVRLSGHFMGDPAGYITGKDEEYQIDPIPVYRSRLIEDGVISEQEALDIEVRVRSEVDAAINFALEADYPGIEDALNCTFA
jgi:TPP-dependent pyruvate/acetoin dehydrogenase alpha subunit